MKALLVNPSSGDIFWALRDMMKIVRKKAPCVPLGLLTVASMLPRDWAVRLVDMNAERLTEEMIHWADLVFIGATFGQRESVKEVVSRCREVGKTTVGGGPLFSSCPDACSEIDHLVLNEAEVTLPPFLNDLMAGTLCRVYTSQEKPSLALTPIPAWDLIDVGSYAAMSVQFSRGCPNNCEFCSCVALYGREPRVKSNEQMITELEAIYNTGWRGLVFITDDNFAASRSKAKTVLEAISLWQEAFDFPFDLYTNASVSIAKDEELMQLMARAGFVSVFVGLETPEEKCLTECGKHQNRSVDLIGAVKTMQRHGMEVCGGFMLGFDNDPFDIVDRQVKFIQKSGVVRAQIAMLQAIPGTRLFKRLEQEHRLTDNSAQVDWVWGLNFATKMEPRHIREGYLSLLNQIYNPKVFYNRVMQFLEHYRPRKRKGYQGGDLTTLVNSIVHLGILDDWSACRCYWKLLFKVLLGHRRALREVVSQLIFAYQARKHVKRNTTQILQGL